MKATKKFVKHSHGTKLKKRKLFSVVLGNSAVQKFTTHTKWQCRYMHVCFKKLGAVHMIGLKYQNTKHTANYKTRPIVSFSTIELHNQACKISQTSIHTYTKT